MPATKFASIICNGNKLLFFLIYFEFDAKGGME